MLNPSANYVRKRWERSDRLELTVTGCPRAVTSCHRRLLNGHDRSHSFQRLTRSCGLATGLQYRNADGTLVERKSYEEGRSRIEEVVGSWRWWQ